MTLSYHKKDRKVTMGSILKLSHISYLLIKERETRLRAYKTEFKLNQDRKTKNILSKDTTPE